MDDPSNPKIVFTAEDQSAAVFAQVRGALGGLGESIVTARNLMGTLAGALGAASFAELILSTNEAIAKYGDLAHVAGTTAETISSMELPAREAGLSLDTVASAVAKLGKSLGDARLDATGAKAGLFKALGIDPQDGRDSAAVMLEVGKALLVFKDQAIAGDVASQLMGKSFAELRPFMANVAEQGELVARTTGAQTEAAKLLNNQLVQLKMASEDMTRHFVGELQPALTDITAAFLQLSKGKDDMQSFGETLGDALKYLAVAAGSFWLGLKDMGDAIGALAAQGAALASLDFAAVKAIGQARDEQYAKNEAQLTAFQKHILEANATVVKSAAAGTGSGEDAANEAEVKAALIAQKNREQIYLAKIAAQEGFYTKYAEGIKAGNALIQAQENAGLIIQQDDAKRQLDNEARRLQGLIDALTKERAIQLEYGKLGDAAKSAEKIQLAQNQLAQTQQMQAIELQIYQKHQDDIYNVYVQGQAKIGANVVASLRSQRQVENDDYQQKRAALIAYDLANEIEEKVHEERLEQLNKDHEARLLGVTKVFHELNLESSGWLFGQLAVMMQSHHRAAFELGKVAALSQAVVQMILGAQQAYTAMSSIPYVGPALGVIAAAAAYAAGGINIDKIRSTQFGSGDSGGSSGGGGAMPTFNASPVTGAPTASPPSTLTPAAATPAPPPAQISVTLIGSAFSYDTIVNELIPLLNEAGANGAEITVTRG